VDLTLVDGKYRSLGWNEGDEFGDWRFVDFNGIMPPSKHLISSAAPIGVDDSKETRSRSRPRF
jgi:hypothetical protein